MDRSPHVPSEREEGGGERERDKSKRVKEKESERPKCFGNEMCTGAINLQWGKNEAKKIKSK